MAIRVKATRDALATAYGQRAAYACLFTADPGTSGSATGEVSGGSPAYARKQLTWSAPNSSSAITAQATFDVPAGATVTYVGVAQSGTAGTADVVDSAAVPSQTFSSQGTYTITFTYTQS